MTLIKLFLVYKTLNNKQTHDNNIFFNIRYNFFFYFK